MPDEKDDPDFYIRLAAGNDPAEVAAVDAELVQFTIWLKGQTQWMRRFQDDHDPVAMLTHLGNMVSKQQPTHNQLLKLFVMSIYRHAYPVRSFDGTSPEARAEPDRHPQLEGHTPPGQPEAGTDQTPPPHPYGQRAPGNDLQ